MRILREKMFGKLDALEAQRRGISVAELRARRAAAWKIPASPTNTVHDVINSGGNIESGFGQMYREERSRANRLIRKGKSQSKDRNRLAFTEAQDKLAEQMINESIDRQIKTREAQSVRQEEMNKFLKNKNNTPAPKPAPNPTPKPNPTTTTTPTGTGSKLGSSWIKQNPGKSAAIGATAVALTAAGIGAYKHYKDKKKKEA